MNDSMNDVVIVGAGPAGCTAAALLAARERRVALIDRKDPRKAGPRSVWIGENVIDILGAAGVDAAAPPRQSIRRVHFLSADLKQHVQTELPDAFASFVDMRDLLTALIERAVGAGAKTHFNTDARALQTDEDAVRVACAGEKKIVGRLAVVSPGCQKPAVGLVPQPAAASTGVALRCHAEIDGAVGEKLPETADDAIHIVLDAQSPVLGMVWARGDRLVVDVSGAERPEAFRAAVKTMADQLVASGVALPLLKKTIHKTPLFISPAGLALEAESHVIKRGLVVGDAGGFVGAASHEGIFPAMKSAQIAAEVIHEALDQPEIQDHLHQFENKWRMNFAPHLQPLDSDMRFLQPLVFSNESIAAKVACHLLGGRSE